MTLNSTLDLNTTITVAGEKIEAIIGTIEIEPTYDEYSMIRHKPSDERNPLVCSDRDGLKLSLSPCLTLTQILTSVLT